MFAYFIKFFNHKISPHNNAYPYKYRKVENDVICAHF